MLRRVTRGVAVYIVSQVYVSLKVVLDRQTDTEKDGFVIIVLVLCHFSTVLVG